MGETTTSAKIPVSLLCCFIKSRIVHHLSHLACKLRLPLYYLPICEIFTTNILHPSKILVFIIQIIQK